MDSQPQLASQISAGANCVQSGDLLGDSGLVDVWSYGGGTQSVAIAALIVQGKLPKPKLVVIADTEKERSTTWAYADAVTIPALEKIGLTLHRLSKSEWAYNHDDLWNRKGTILIPAFTDKSGEKGKLTGFCNAYWKRDVMENYLRRVHGLRERDMRRWIGYSIDEGTRVWKCMNGSEYKAGRIRLPLVELALKRRDSIQLVEDMGWPTPPRSACWMCPNQTDAEWLDLKENSPAEFALAVKTEREMRERDPHLWLHEDCVPLDTVNFSRPDNLFMRACDAGEASACFT